jgi:hypothetical protein
VPADTATLAQVTERIAEIPPVAGELLADIAAATAIGSGWWPGGTASNHACMRTDATCCGAPTNFATCACSWFTTSMGSQDRTRDQSVNAREAHSEPREADLERRETAVTARETAVAERETAVAGRETAVAARDAAHAERIDAAQEIGAAADKRDAASGARDAAADKRESELDRAEMLDPEGGYGAHWPERRNAGLDRGHAKDDRTASHGDRVALTENDSNQTET